MQVRLRLMVTYIGEWDGTFSRCENFERALRLPGILPVGSCVTIFRDAKGSICSLIENYQFEMATGALLVFLEERCVEELERFKQFQKLLHQLGWVIATPSNDA